MCDIYIYTYLTNFIASETDPGKLNLRFPPNPRFVQRICNVGLGMQPAQTTMTKPPAWREECQDSIKRVNILSLTPNQYLRFRGGGWCIQSSLIASIVATGHSMFTGRPLDCFVVYA